MASNFPTSLDTGSEQPSPVSGTGLDDAGFEHDVVHANHSTALIAVETKVGIGSSTPVADSVLAGSAAGVSGWDTAPSLLGLTVDTSTLVVDSTNNRVGIGTTTPLEQVEIAGVNDRTALRLSGAGGSSSVTGKVYLGMHQWASGANPSVRIGAEEISASNYDANLVFQTRDSGSDVLPTTRMTIDHEGNVGIGTTAPLKILHVEESDSGVTPSASHHVIFESANDMGVLIGSGTTNNGYIRFGDSGSQSAGGFNYDHADNSLKIRTNGTDHIKISSAGNVGIGTTSPSSTLHVAGALTIKSGSYLAGYLYGTSASAGAGFSVVGSAGASIGFMGSPNNDDMHYQSTHTSGYYYLMVGNTYRCYSTNVGGWYPYEDNTYDLGYSSKRWDDVWATNGTIQTSDVNFKKDIADTTLGLDFINALRPVEYKWLEGSRKHQGFIAQEVETVLDTQDIAADQAMWGINVFKDGETHIEPIEDENGIPQKVEVPTIPKQSLRYNEFIGPLVKAVQELSARIETLETV